MYSTMCEEFDPCRWFFVQAYQLLHRDGVPDDRIVVMVYDDIAHNPMNPRPGTIINHPKGGDVYKGMPKDYTRSDVTATNFLAALRGDEVRV